MRISPKRVRQARHKAGFTQEQLARAAGVNVRNIVRWEHTNPTNGSQPRAENVAAIAKATGQEISFFFAGDDEDEEEPDATRDLANVLARNLELMVHSVVQAEGEQGARSLRGMLPTR